MTPATQDAFKKWTLRAGLIAGVTGAGFSFLLGEIFIWVEDPTVYIYTIIAFIVTSVFGYIIWKISIRTPQSITKVKGAIAGTLIGVIPNPIIWIIISLIIKTDTIQVGEVSIRVTIDLLILGSLMAAMMSFIFGGFLAIPIGAIGGAIIAHFQAKDPAFQSTPPKSPTGDDPLPASNT